MEACQSMRVMNLPEVSISSDHQDAIGRYRARLSSGLRTPSGLSQLLLAYMAWPNDEELRDIWMASGNARRLAHRGTTSPTPIALFGGLEAVSLEALGAVGSRLETDMKSWAPVADVMQMLVDLSSPDMRLSAGPSISKAIELCADDGAGLSQSQMRKKWSRFRDAAHLIAAGALLACEVPEGGGSIFAAAWYAPDSLLAIAAGLEQFGLSFTPHGQSHSFPLQPLGVCLPIAFRTSHGSSAVHSLKDKKKCWRTTRHKSPTSERANPSHATSRREWLSSTGADRSMRS